MKRQRMRCGDQHKKAFGLTLAVVREEPGSVARLGAASGGRALVCVLALPRWGGVIGNSPFSLASRSEKS